MYACSGQRPPSFLLSCRWWGMNSGCQVRWQGTSSGEPFYHYYLTESLGWMLSLFYLLPWTHSFTCVSFIVLCLRSLIILEIWLRQACDVSYPPTLIFFLSLLRMINSSCYFFFFEISFSFSSLNTKLDRNDNSLISETVFLLKTELQDIDPFVSHWKKNQHLRTQSLRAVFYTTFQ